MTETTAAPAQPVAGWVEPASLLPLRWGRYRPRAVTGLVLVTLGVASVQITTTYSLQFLALGCLLQAVGWTVMPSAGWRRMTVFVPAILASCLLLAGGAFAASFALILLAWLLVRHRPPLTFVLAVAPVALGIIASGAVIDSIEIYYSSAWTVLVAGAVVTVGCAWAARAFARWSLEKRASVSATPAPSEPASERNLHVGNVPDEASGTHRTISRDPDDLR